MAPAELPSTPPSVMWAQRSNCIFLTFNVECPKPDIKIENNSISFRGLCAPDDKLNSVDIPLYAEVDPEKSTISNKGRSIEVILAKLKNNGPFWPALTSDKIKHHWLKIDFNKWQDEDESGEEFDESADMFSSRMGDFGSDQDDKDAESSDEDEDLPELE